MNPYQSPTIPNLSSPSLAPYGVGGISAKGNPFLMGDVNPLDLYKSYVQSGMASPGGTSAQQSSDQQLRAQLFSPGKMYTDQSGALQQFDSSMTGNSSRITTPLNVSRTGAGGTDVNGYQTFGGVQGGNITQWNPRGLPVVPYSNGSKSTDVIPPMIPR